MDPTMDNTKHILNYLMPIIDQVNPELHDFMQRYVHSSVYAHTCTRALIPLCILALVSSSQVQLHLTAIIC